MVGIGLAVTDSIKRYSKPMLLFKRDLIKNRTNASYEKKIDRKNSTKFEGVFLLKSEENIELFNSNVYIREIRAKVYTLSTLDFNREDQVLIGDNWMEIISLVKYFDVYFYGKVGYTILMLRKL
ncbi:DUF1506 family protein [Borrelia anserina]|nr:DUF1506 family protein [Borrelia anserina]